MINNLYSHFTKVELDGKNIDTRMRIENYMHDTLVNTMCFNSFAIASLSNEYGLQRNDTLYRYILSKYCMWHIEKVGVSFQNSSIAVKSSIKYSEL